MNRDFDAFFYLIHEIKNSINALIKTGATDNLLEVLWIAH